MRSTRGNCLSDGFPFCLVLSVVLRPIRLDILKGCICIDARGTCMVLLASGVK